MRVPFSLVFSYSEPEFILLVKIQNGYQNLKTMTRHNETEKNSVISNLSKPIKVEVVLVFFIAIVKKKPVQKMIIQNDASLKTLGVKVLDPKNWDKKS